jgi:hypothetical protein
MCHTGSLHSEALEGPVSCGDGADETGSDVVALELEGIKGVELGRARRFLEDFVDGGLKIGIESFEKVLEEEGQKLTGSSGTYELCDGDAKQNSLQL